MVLTRAQREGSKADEPAATSTLKAPAKRGRKPAAATAKKTAAAAPPPVPDDVDELQMEIDAPKPRATRKTAAKTTTASKTTTTAAAAKKAVKASESKPATRTRRGAAAAATAAPAPEVEEPDNAQEQETPEEPSKPTTRGTRGRVATGNTAAAASKSAKKSTATAKTKASAAKEAPALEPTKATRSRRTAAVKTAEAAVEEPVAPKTTRTKRRAHVLDDEEPAVPEPSKRPTRRGAAIQDAPKAPPAKKAATAKTKAAAAAPSKSKAARKPEVEAVEEKHVQVVFEEPESHDDEMAQEPEQLPKDTDEEHVEESVAVKVDTPVEEAPEVKEVPVKAAEEDKSELTEEPVAELTPEKAQEEPAKDLAEPMAEKAQNDSEAEQTAATPVVEESRPATPEHSSVEPFMSTIKVKTPGLFAFKMHEKAEQPVTSTPHVSKTPLPPPSTVKTTNMEVLEDPFVNKSAKTPRAQPATDVQEEEESEEDNDKENTAPSEPVPATPIKTFSLFGQSKTPALKPALKKPTIMAASARKAPANSPFKLPAMPMTAMKPTSTGGFFSLFGSARKAPAEKSSLFQSARKAPAESLFKSSLTTPAKPAAPEGHLKSSLMQGSARKPPPEALSKASFPPVKGPTSSEQTKCSLISSSPRKGFHMATGTFADDSKPHAPAFGNSLLQEAPRKLPADSPIKSAPNPFVNVVPISKPTPSFQLPPVRLTSPARTPRVLSSTKAFAEETPSNSPLLDARTPPAPITETPRPAHPLFQSETAAGAEEQEHQQEQELAQTPQQEQSIGDVEMEDAPEYEEESTITFGEPQFESFNAPVHEDAVDDDMPSYLEDELAAQQLGEETLARANLFAEMPALSAINTPAKPEQQQPKKAVAVLEAPLPPAPVFSAQPAAPASPTKSALRSPLKSLMSPKKTVTWRQLNDVQELPPPPPAKVLGPLAGLTFYVDVTANGVDSGDLFAPLIEEMGARCVSNWNGDSAITHVLFKDGKDETLEKVRKAKAMGRELYCVNLGWVLECERIKQRVLESGYAIQLQPLGISSNPNTPRHSMASVLTTRSPNTPPTRTTTTIGLPSPGRFSLSSAFKIKTPLFTLGTTGSNKENGSPTPAPSTVKKAPAMQTAAEEDEPTPEGTPAYLVHPEALQQRTCPPKQVLRSFPGALSPSKPTTPFKARLMKAKRRSLESVSSAAGPAPPLGRTLFS